MVVVEELGLVTCEKNVVDQKATQGGLAPNQSTWKVEVKVQEDEVEDGTDK